jgi:hypothetical protein
MCILVHSTVYYMVGSHPDSLLDTVARRERPSFPSFYFPDVLCDPTDLIWR